ncbi:uncharacterized protein LOC128092976 [Culex pipiens pallens]|uniref:uncharacterized protein LOC128092976 n=1 Tax=Culex pipiens pallens TaxID=42434 RepID=UPI0022AA757E|nr:uncharacterized protein LOC128092976 [Culex pipiens pallens]
MDELKDLLKQERQLILTINGVGDFVEAYKKAEHENQISTRLDTLEEAMRKFFKVRRKIEAMIDDEDEHQVVGESKEARKKRLADLVVQREMEYNKALRDVEERYFVVKAKLVALRPVLQSIKANRPSEGDGRQNRSRVSTAHTSSQSQRRCLFCEETFHMPFNCSKLRNMPVSQRVEEVNRRRLCRNCLHAGHYADGCSRGSCSRCGGKHHTLLHYDTPAPAGAPQERSSVPNTQNQSQEDGQQQQQPTRQQDQTQNISTQPTTSFYSVIQSTSRNTHPPPPTDFRNTTTLKAASLPAQNAPTFSRRVLMSTAVVRVEDQFGNFSLARTLLDSCSEFCYISHTFSKKLKFRTTPDVLSVQGIGNGSALSLEAVRAKIQPRLATISMFSKEMKFHVLEKIASDLPVTPVDVSQMMLPCDIILADPHFGKPGPIDMIIGAEFFFDLLAAGRRKIVEDGPTLQETVFGWIVSGKVPVSSPSVPCTATYFSSTVDLKGCCKLESSHVKSAHAVEESTREELFKKTTNQDAKGRSDSVEEASTSMNKVRQVTDSADVTVKKWISHCPELLKQLPKHLKDEHSTLNTLHSVVHACVFCQQLWRVKSDRDQPSEESLQQLWRVRMRLTAVATSKVPRWIWFSNDCVEVTSYGSERAYGASLYLRCTALENPKRKKKKVNIPRLEMSPGRWSRRRRRLRAPTHNWWTASCESVFVCRTSRTANGRFDRVSSKICSLSIRDSQEFVQTSI